MWAFLILIKSRLPQKQQPESKLSVCISSVVLVLILIILLVLVLILILILVLILIVLLILVLVVVHFNLSCGINLTLKPTALRLFTARTENIRQSSIYLDSTSSLTAPNI